MKRLATFLLLFCVTLGLAAQQPAQALAPPMGQMDMAPTVHMDMAGMPDCMATMANDAAPKPCKCGLAGCLAMMASGSSMMLAADPVTPGAVNASEPQDHVTVVTALRGRSTAPEPEPPTVLI